jgi:uncharacterized protein
MDVLRPIGLLLMANVFMTFAWYGHLRDLKTAPLWVAIGVSWGIAFVEYCFQVPANRIGITQFNLAQLKVMQEIISMVVFAGFSVWYMRLPLTRNYVFASMLLAAAAYLIFSDRPKV